LSGGGGGVVAAGPAVAALLAPFASWWYVGTGNSLQLPPVVAIVFVHVQNKLDFSLGLLRRCTEAVGPTKLTFEGGNKGPRVVAGVGLQNDVGVRWFLEDLGGDAIVII
jgi:hypothetical protein